MRVTINSNITHEFLPGDLENTKPNKNSRCTNGQEHFIFPHVFTKQIFSEY